MKFECTLCGKLLRITCEVCKSRRVVYNRAGAYWVCDNAHHFHVSEVDRSQLCSDCGIKMRKELTNAR